MIQDEDEVFVDRRRSRGLGLNTPFNFKDDFPSEDIVPEEVKRRVQREQNPGFERSYDNYADSNYADSDYADSDYANPNNVLVFKKSRIWLFFELILYVLGGVGGLILLGVNWAFVIATHGKTLALTVILVIAYLIYLGFLTKVILEYKTQTLTITEDSIRLRTGIIAARTKEVFWEKVNSVGVSQSVTARILFYGDIQITVGNDEYATFKAIHNPNKIKSIIGERISNSRRQHSRGEGRR